MGDARKWTSCSGASFENRRREEVKDCASPAARAPAGHSKKRASKEDRTPEGLPEKPRQLPHLASQGRALEEVNQRKAVNLRIGTPGKEISGKEPGVRYVHCGLKNRRSGGGRRSSGRQLQKNNGGRTGHSPQRCLAGKT